MLEVLKIKLNYNTIVSRVCLKEKCNTQWNNLKKKQNKNDVTNETTVPLFLRFRMRISFKDIKIGGN